MNHVNRPSILKLNSGWQPIGFMSAYKAFPDMVTGAVIGLHLSWPKDADDYNFSNPEEIWPVMTWEEWIQLPIREYDEWINTPNARVRMPKIVIAHRFNQMPAVKVSKSKKAVFERDGYQCQYSGETVDPAEANEKLNIDHVIPSSKGGSSNWDNVVTSLKSINSIKDNKTPEEAGLKLQREPREPEAKTLMQRAKEQSKSEHHTDEQHAFFMK